MHCFSDRHHGKLLEEGASGFLKKRLAPEEDKETKRNVDWSSFNKLCSSSTSTAFGSKNWASVYLASTPQQAKELGLNFPGVDEVKYLHFLMKILYSFDYNMIFILCIG